MDLLTPDLSVVIPVAIAMLVVVIAVVIYFIGKNRKRR